MVVILLIIIACCLLFVGETTKKGLSDIFSTLLILFLIATIIGSCGS